jgi:hypothetical protein
MEKLLQTVALNYDLKDVLLGNAATEIASCFSSSQDIYLSAADKGIF